jgi:hypothetical protein
MIVIKSCVEKRNPKPLIYFFLAAKKTLKCMVINLEENELYWAVLSQRAFSALALSILWYHTFSGTHSCVPVSSWNFGDECLPEPFPLTQNDVALAFALMAARSEVIWWIPIWLSTFDSVLQDVNEGLLLLLMVIPFLFSFVFKWVTDESCRTAFHIYFHTSRTSPRFKINSLFRIALFGLLGWVLRVICGFCENSMRRFYNRQVFICRFKTKFKEFLW